jgi:hypothetical protein
VEGTLRFLLPPSVLLLCAAAAESLWGLPEALRAVLAASFAVLVVLGVRRRHLQPLRALSAAALLRRAEEEHPSARARLVPAWELGRAGTLAGTSTALAEEHVRRTEALVAGLPRRRLFPGPSRRALFLGGTAAALWALALPWLGSRPFLRVLAPWRDARLEEALDIRPGSVRVPWGASVELSASWRSAPAAGARLSAPELWLRSEGGRWLPASWDAEGPRPSYRVGALSAPLEYRLRHRGARSAVYLLQPVPYARLDGLAVSIQPPGGRRQVVALEGGARLSGLRGSWVSVSGTADRPLSSAELELSFLGTPVPMRARGGGRWEGGFPLKESGTMKIRLSDAQGLRESEPAPFQLTALDDLPPSVELLSPAFDVEMSPLERLPVAFEARDDHGLSSVRLVYRLAGRAETRLPARRLDGTPTRSTGDFLWDLAGLPPGAVVEFWVEAADDAMRPQTGASRHGTLKLVDFDSVHARAEAGLRAAEGALTELARRERDAAAALRGLEKAGAESKAAARAGADAAQAPLSESWKAAEDALDGLSEAARGDPYANPGMADAAQGAAEALKELRAGELARAGEDSRAGRTAQAAAGHERLAAKVGRAAAALREGRQMQALQDLWVGAHRADQAGRELGKTLDELSAGGRAPSAEEKKALDDAMAGLRRQIDELQRAVSSMPQADAAALSEKDRKVVSVPLGAAGRSLDAVQEALARGDYAGAARAARRLSEELSRVRSALSEAARAQAENSSSSEEARALERAMELWKEAAAKQGGALQLTQSLEEGRLGARRAAQETLLRRLAEEQAGVVRDAAKLGDPTPPEAAAWMRKALKEFEAGQVQESPALLERASRRLRAQAAALSRAPQGPPPSAAALEELAAREDSVRERLRAGPSEPPLGEGELSERMAASAVQHQASRKTEELGSRLDELSSSGAELPEGSLRSVSDARAEQKSAEGSLARGESGPAQKSQESALELLENGLKSLSEAAARRKSSAQSSLAPFQKPRAVARSGARGRSGVDTSFVPLPGSEEYQPPREIRQEVERSLRERRPGAFDAIIRDYLKRMSQ